MIVCKKINSQPNTIGDFNEFLVCERSLFDGWQQLYEFPNCYGASIVRHFGSYGGSEGLWELALIRWDNNHHHYELVYNDEFDDTIGWLTLDDSAVYLNKIKNLPEMNVEDDNDD